MALLEVNDLRTSFFTAAGEVRAVNRVEARIAEADKLGFDKIFVSKYSVKGLDTSKYKIKVVPIATIGQLFKELF